MSGNVHCVQLRAGFINFNIKNGFLKAIPKRIYCVHFVHCIEDSNIITATSPSPAVTQEKGGGGDRKKLHEV